jgi:hypothetical protein
MPKMCAVYPCTRFRKPPDRETQHPGEIDAPWRFLPTSTKRPSRHTPSGIESPRTDDRTVAAKRYRAPVQQFRDEPGGRSALGC